MAVKRSGPPSGSSDGISLESAILQIGLMCAIFYLWSSPVLQPAKIMVVLFHEMSHGLMAILTGGKVLKIWITPGEGGTCETEGGMPLLIVSAGYLGSMVFGGIILYLSRFRFFIPMVCGMLALLVVSAIVTVFGDSYTRTFASALAAIFIANGFVIPSSVGGILLRAVGTICCLYTIFDIYCDILSGQGGGEVLNDAAVFARLSGGSAHSVGMAWLTACLIFFLAVLRFTLKPLPQPERAG